MSSADIAITVQPIRNQHSPSIRLTQLLSGCMLSNPGEEIVGLRIN